ncbi:MAG TPA: acetyl-CoA carboxylase carboxyl transferase subunit alpha [Streptosporangiaceae bacterium]|nr:acetyl-CoA carboxylase carboxyl transferase subunit alpha [Streptosporangiaceae bacterium]
MTRHQANGVLEVAVANTDDEPPQWTACSGCGELIYWKRFERCLRVCPGCGWHSRLTATQRVRQLLDPGSARPIPSPSTVEDPLAFIDSRAYTERLQEARRRTGIDESVICVRGSIGGHPIVAAVMDFGFLGGSLGCGAGERIADAAASAVRDRTPLLMVTASGGARMQEGALSLMQMAKVTQALLALDDAGLLTVTVVTDPTYGGVAASFATQADVIIAERDAHLGFAGPRVIEQTIRQQLPPGFQTAAFLRDRGLIDEVVPRSAIRPALIRLLSAVAPRQATGPARMPRPAARPATQAKARRDPWDVLRLARRLDRPTTSEYAGMLLDVFYELHGDTLAGDCAAIVGGLGRFDGRPVMLIGHQKGHTAQELTVHNFGMPTPSGYRKASRLMRLAGKLGVPVITLIDTSGAYPGIEAERDGQAWAIADALRVMASLPVPTVAVVTGEGGSGGALALGLADRVLVLENSVYSVISPEGCAAILWKDAGTAKLAARALRIDPPELLRQGIADRIISEPPGGAHINPGGAAELIRTALRQVLDELSSLDPPRLLADRRRRFGAFGAKSAGAESDTRRREGGAA